MSDSQSTPFMLTEEQFLALDNTNPDLKKIEYDREKIQITMGTVGFISAFTATILAIVVFWNQKKKFGKTFDAQADFIMPEGNHKIPDVALVKFTEKLYDDRGFVAASPFLAIEVISQKHGLQHDLRKMTEHWIASGTRIGLVIDPYREQYHKFEPEVETYQTYPFSEPFTHPQLPGLEIDFAQILQSAKE